MPHSYLAQFSSAATLFFFFPYGLLYHYCGLLGVFFSCLSLLSIELDK